MNRKLNIEVHSDGNCKIRPATSAESAEALLLESRRVKLEKKKAKIDSELREIARSQLRVFYDTPGLPGHPYHVRHFVASGKKGVI